MRPSSVDRLIRLPLGAAAIISGGLLTIIVVFLVRESLPAFTSVGLRRLLLDASWYPASSASGGTFGLAPMIAGTLAAAAGAVLLAAPCGVLLALFTHEVAPRPVARLQRYVIALMAGIPSVVYGFWGLVVLVPAIREIEPPGASLLAGILVLAIMILPTVALVCEAALAVIPRELDAAAASVGLSRVTRFAAVTWPSMRHAVRTGVLLATGRAIGETMAVLMVAGNVVRVPDSLFDPVRTLTANIALEMGYASGDHRAALFASGVVLITLVILVVGAASRSLRSREFGSGS